MKMRTLFYLIPFAITTLTGCQGQEDKTLNIVISGLQQASERTFFRTFVRLFQAEYGYEVNITYKTAEELMSQIVSEMAGDITTDVIMVDTAHMSHYVEQDYLQPLDNLDAYSDRTMTTIFNDYTHLDGKRYFAPVSFDIYLSMFNKKALPYMPSSVDVSRDSNQTITGINAITWQEIAEWATTIKIETGVAKFGFPYADASSQLIYPLSGISASMGAYTLPSFNTEGSINAWSYLRSLYQDGALAYGAKFATQTQPSELLSSEDIWLSFGHMGPLGGVYQARPNDFVLGPAPSDEVTTRSSSTAGAWAYGIVKEAKHLKASQAWIEFVTDPEINYLYCTGLGGVISPISEVIAHLGTSSADQIMRVGLSLFNNNIDVMIVDTSGYSNWSSVKTLYVELYTDLLAGLSINLSHLNSYQNQLDFLKTST